MFLDGVDDAFCLGALNQTQCENHSEMGTAKWSLMISLWQPNLGEMDLIRESASYVTTLKINKW